MFNNSLFMSSRSSYVSRPSVSTFNFSVDEQTIDIKNVVYVSSLPEFFSGIQAPTQNYLKTKVNYLSFRLLEVAQ